jgi:hypothetical protein
MSKDTKVFLASLVVGPLFLFGILMCFITMLAFVTWEWYLAFNGIPYLACFRVCCVIGWVLSVAFIISCD